jgi:hypothetical protein
MFTSRSSAKWRNIQSYPYASLCVDSRKPPYAPIILYGPITEVYMLTYELVYHMPVRYFGEKKGGEFADGYKSNSSETVAFRLTPDRIVQNLDSWFVGHGDHYTLCAYCNPYVFSLEIKVDKTG